MTTRYEGSSRAAQHALVREIALVSQTAFNIPDSLNQRAAPEAVWARDLVKAAGLVLAAEYVAGDPAQGKILRAAAFNLICGPFDGLCVRGVVTPRPARVG